MLQTKKFEVGMLQTNCYIVSCSETKEAIIIDPGFDNKLEAEAIFSYINWNGLKPTHIINTHGHPDHTNGNHTIKTAYNIPIAIHHADAHMLGETGKPTAHYFGYNQTSPPADIHLHENDTIKIGKNNLTTLHTPGHSPGSITLTGENTAYTGDTLFTGSIGRTDFPQSNNNHMQTSLKKLLTLPNNTTIYPGHGPTTTITQEKQTNPFITNL